MPFSYVFLFVFIFITVIQPKSSISKHTNQSLPKSELNIENTHSRGLAISKVFEQYNNGFQGEYGKMQLVIMNAQKDKVTRVMTQQIIEVSGEGDRSIIEFESPADVRGTKLLTHTMKTSKNKQWLYLPSIKRVKRINSRNQAVSFMGSEFYYEDLASQEVEKYKHTFLRSETFQGRSCFLLERVPNEKHSGYQKLHVWLDREYYAPLKIDYFDRKGELLKTAIFSEYKQHGKWWRQNKIVMNNHQTSKQSIIVWTEQELQKIYSSAQFFKRSLKN